MSVPNTSVHPGDKDKEYTFISDPDHKESLSGRVRSACLTCRRKKTKCSGEINCRTCREKGLVCEGLPERKKPSRDTSVPSVLKPTSPGRIERKRRSSKTVARRPSIVLNQEGDERDSSRGQPDSLATTASAPAQSSRIVTSPPGAGAATHRPRVDTWQLNFVPDKRSSNQPTPIAPRRRAPAGNQNASARNPSPTGQPAAVRPRDFSCPIIERGQSWMNDPDHSLFWETEWGQPFDGLRRQSVSFPLPPPGVSELIDGSIMLQNRHGVFDDMALLLANRVPRTGMTLNGTTDFASLWDVNGIDFLAPMPDTVGLPVAPQEQAQQHMDTMNAAPTMSDLSSVQDPAGFDAFWPG